MLWMAGSAPGQPAASGAIEFVESIPIGARLDNDDIRNTAEVWTEMIRGARRTIDLEQFYLSPQKGETLDAVISALEEAANRNVQIRVIVDSGMYRTYPALADSFSRMKNFSVRVLDFNRVAGGPQHAKYFIIDGESLFIGSQNFDWRALSHIHELGVRIIDQSLAAVYQSIFDLDWRLAAAQNPDSIRQQIIHRSYPLPFQLVDSRYGKISILPSYSPRSLIPDTACWDEHRIVALLESAQKQISLQFLSYSTRGRDGCRYQAIDGALRRAAARHVRVRLLVADWQKGSRAEAALKELAALPNIEVRFSCIPEWSGGYVPFARVEHCKYIVVDDQSFWLGTSNCEKSYYYSLRNVGLVIQNRAMAERLRRIFDTSWGSDYAEPVDPAASYSPRRHGE